MPNRLLAPAAMATLLCLTTTAAVAQSPTQPPETMNAERGWSSVARCAQEESERARHTCVDDVLREAGLLTTEMRTRQQRRAFGLDDKPAPAPSPAPVSPGPVAPSNASPAAVAKSPETVAPSPATVAPATQPDRIEVELAAVEKAVNGRLFVTTTDGAVWLQTESVEMPQPPVAGDRMSIRKGSMGGYRCTVASTRLTYRCARNR
jgi:hypothetical protein